MNAEKKYILDKNTAAKKLERMAFEIAEQNVGETDVLILAGIKENGVDIAHIIANHLKGIFKGTITVLEIELNNKRKPDSVTVSATPSYDGASIVVIDDVSNSGKTMLYALQPFLQYLPKKMQTLVLVERSHKAFPVHNDYVGISLATTEQEHIFVEVENGMVTGAYLV